MREIFTFIQLQNMPPNRISAFWKVTHVLIYALLAICGFAVYYALTKAMDNFEGNCAIGAKVAFFMEGNVYGMDFLTTKWERRDTCNICIYIPATTCACAIIWFAFLYISGYSEGAHKSRCFLQPWRTVMPNICYSLIMFVASCYAIGTLEGGIAQLCASFEKNHDSADCSAMWIYLPAHEKQAVVSVYLYDPYMCFIAGRIGSWAIIWLWLASIVLSLTRIFYSADFLLVKVMLFRTPENLTLLGPSEKSVTFLTSSQVSLESEDEEHHWLMDVEWNIAVREEVLENGIRAFRFSNNPGVIPRQILSDTSSSELSNTRDTAVQTSPNFRLRRVKLKKLFGNAL